VFTAVDGNVKFRTGLVDAGAKTKVEDGFSKRRQSKSRKKTLSKCSQGFPVPKSR